MVFRYIAWPESVIPICFSVDELRVGFSILPFSKWEKNVTRQPRADTGSYFIALPVADRQKGVI